MLNYQILLISSYSPNKLVEYPDLSATFYNVLCQIVLLNPPRPIYLASREAVNLIMHVEIATTKHKLVWNNARIDPKITDE